MFKDTEDGGGSPVPFNVVILFLKQIIPEQWPGFISMAIQDPGAPWRVKQFGRVAIAPAVSRHKAPVWEDPLPSSSLPLYPASSKGT